MSEDISGKDFLAAEGLEGWRIISDGACAFYATPSFGASTKLVDGIGGIGGIDEHPPKLDVRHDGVTVRSLTERAEGFRLTTTDLELAQAVSRIATEQGLTADPAAIQSLIVIPGATDRSAIMPFWKAVLGYQPRIDSPDEDLVDPHERDAAFWFEQMDEPRAMAREPSTSPSSCRSSRRRRGSMPPSRPAARWSMTPMHPSGGRSRIRRATRLTSPPADADSSRYDSPMDHDRPELLAAELRAIERRRLSALCDADMSACRHWHTDIYGRRDGRWQAVWSQATRIRSP
jgi:4a-hydroxytetrahydrobiopterin dehydratase